MSFHPAAPLGDSDFAGAVGHVVDRTWKSLLGIGVVSVILGIVVLAWPGPTLLAVAVLFGVYLLMSGVFQVAATFGVPAAGGWWRFLTFVSGALSLVLGFIAIGNPGDSLVLLAIWIGIGWIFRGVTGAGLYMDEATGLPGRGLGIFLSIVTVVAGAILVIWPIQSIGTLTLVAGISLITVGVVEIVDAFMLKSRAGTSAGNGRQS